ncbi:MAG: crossover junction endodeoxyribonuclease RuvC [Actinomycetes bacterium]
MRILGVDPGLTRCGVGVIELDAKRKPHFVSVNVLRTPADADLPTRLGQLSEQLSEVFAEFAPDVVAVERVFSQHNVRSAMDTASAAAVVMLGANQRGLPVGIYTPTEVKAAVTGTGRADKAQVTAMVTRILNLSEIPKPADAADSLALAICHAWRGVAQMRIATAVAKQSRAVS